MLMTEDIIVSVDMEHVNERGDPFEVNWDAQHQSKWKLSKLQDTTAPQALCCLVFRSLSGSL